MCACVYADHKSSSMILNNSVCEREVSLLKTRFLKCSEFWPHETKAVCPLSIPDYFYVPLYIIQQILISLESMLVQFWKPSHVGWMPTRHRDGVPSSGFKSYWCLVMSCGGWKRMIIQHILLDVISVISESRNVMKKIVLCLLLLVVLTTLVNAKCWGVKSRARDRWAREQLTYKHGR